jgi:hypothetical protein
MLNPTSPWSSSSASSAAALELLRPLSSRRDSPPPAPVRMELCTGRRRAIPGAYCPPLPPPRALPGMGKLRGTVTRCQHRRGAMLSRARGASLVVEEVATRAAARKRAPRGASRVPNRAPPPWPWGGSRRTPAREELPPGLPAVGAGERLGARASSARRSRVERVHD